MARIQILELPSILVGEVLETPFALIVDQAEDLLEDGEFWASFKNSTGAKACAVFTGTIDIPANL